LKHLKEEMVTMIQEESKTFMEAIEEAPKGMEEKIVKEKPSKMTMVKKESEEKETVTEKKSSSTMATKSKVSAKENKQQKKIQKAKQVVKNMERIMDKVDKNVKDVSKNLKLKNIIKSRAMIGDQVSLASYNVPFYKSQDIYLDSPQIADLRKIYANVDLTDYKVNDPVFIYQTELNSVRSARQELEIALGGMKWEN